MINCFLFAALSTLGLFQELPKVAENLNGTWAIVTKADDGSDVTGSLVLSGGPSNYTGVFRMSNGRDFPLSEVAVSAKALYFVADLGEAMLVIRVVPDQSGRLAGVWGAARPMMPVSLTRK